MEPKQQKTVLLQPTQKLQETEEKRLEEILSDGLPTCGGDLHSPVVDTARYVEEIRWNIGGRTFIANADGGGL